MSDDLITWLRGVLDEDERAARYAVFDGATGVWSEKPSSGVLTLEGVSGLDGLVPIGDLRLARHMELHDPAAVLADIAAKRAILERYDDALKSAAFNLGLTPESAEFSALSDVVDLLAWGYRHRPGYRTEWAPDGGSVA